jgi:FAD-dependent sensor of blue light
VEFFLYSSSCKSRQFEGCDLDIMRTALTNNAIHGVTGFMHRNKTHYFQCIEGRSEHIEKLVSNLKADERHFDFQTLMTGDIAAPRFSGWSMGYSQVPTGGDAANGITVSDSAEAILTYLLTEADRQMASLVRTEEMVREARV